MADHNVGVLRGTISREVVNMAKHLKDLDKQLFKQILKGELAAKASLKKSNKTVTVGVAQ